MFHAVIHFMCFTKGFTALLADWSYTQKDVIFDCGGFMSGNVYMRYRTN